LNSLQCYLFHFCYLWIC